MKLIEGKQYRLHFTTTHYSPVTGEVIIAQYCGRTNKVPVRFWCCCCDKYRYNTYEFLTTPKGYDGMYYHYGSECIKKANIEVLE